MSLQLLTRSGGAFQVLLSPSDVAGTRASPTSADDATSYLLSLPSRAGIAERWANRDPVLDALFDAATGQLRSDGRVVAVAAQPATYTCDVSKRAFEHLEALV